MIRSQARYSLGGFKHSIFKNDKIGTQKNIIVQVSVLEQALWTTFLCIQNPVYRNIIIKSLNKRKIQDCLKCEGPLLSILVGTVIHTHIYMHILGMSNSTTSCKHLL